ncbi:MAG: V-type ATP synthase subunit A [Anaerolineae bacterium]|jgi:V/A-type H+-transporting ATPase subunit A|nr:V-type ATP synthase subunit A [Anaerolineae bacterium]
MANEVGKIIWVNGPVVRVRGSRTVRMLEMVEVGDEHLIGEVIGLEDDVMTVQVYEENSGMRPGEPVFGTGMSLSVELGPGLLRSIFDGIQRPLPVIEQKGGTFIRRGVKLTSLYRGKKWDFTPSIQEGTEVSGGAILGSVPETRALEHFIMVPPKMSGVITWVAPKGEYTLDDPIAKLNTGAGEVNVTMLQRWPVRHPRPFLHRETPNELLVTGQRILDTFFPLAKGGAAAIPGGFGAGKTITQHQIAKWSNADVVIYIGCGERGNEMTEVLQEFPELIDPRSNHPLMERTVLIANTSNMPVAAREASVYTGIAIGEYYRDMGYDVALMADSTSRWAEALREISGRLEEMPAEEGYPAYLGARLAEFYERAGLVETLNHRKGSVSVIGAVSPPGGDFSEPVTQHTRRYIRTFWALDKALASARHFPSVNWLNSYSEYVETLNDWWKENTGYDWRELRSRAMDIMNEESRLSQIVQLVGPNALPDEQRLILETAHLIKEGFMQQNALDDVDTFSSIEKQIKMLDIILHFHQRAQKAVQLGVLASELHSLKVVNTIIHMKTEVINRELGQLETIQQQIDNEFSQLEQQYV